MATLYVRNVPDKLYRRLRAAAEAERRSLSGEVVKLIEDALGQPGRRPERMADILDRLRVMRESIKLPKDWPGSLALLHEGREERGRR